VHCRQESLTRRQASGHSEEDLLTAYTSNNININNNNNNNN